MADYKVFLCDRCKTESRDNTFLKTVSITRYRDTGNGEDRIQNIELCSDCKELLDTTISSFLESRTP